MADTDVQKRLFEFLVKRFSTQEPFTREDVKKATGWTDSTLRTYWSKQVKPLVTVVDKGRFRVSESFRRFSSWNSFRGHVTQVRSVAQDYSSFAYDALMIFEFFMPLTNESELRTSLDALFYSETIRRRLRTVPPRELEARFPKHDHESAESYEKRAAEWASSKFGGYSILHVDGRFRASSLLSLPDAADFQSKGGRYLIDETTAIVRFIFPCGTPRKTKPPLSGSDLATLIIGSANLDEKTVAEAEVIRWFFGVLFVQSVIEAVNGEDEIWMVESGIQNRLHIWRVSES